MKVQVDEEESTNRKIDAETDEKIKKIEQEEAEGPKKESESVK